MSKSYTVAIDAMSGEAGAVAVCEAVRLALQQHHEAHFLLLGDTAVLQRYLPQHARVMHQHTTEVITMEDSLEVALRQKKQSSMRLALMAVQQQQADVCVSSGNTGALMALSRFILKRIAGIEKPAIMAGFPTCYPHQLCYLLDVGASVDSTPQQLYQFASMAHVFFQHYHQKIPTMGLLNIGKEVIKGNRLVQEAHTLFQKSPNINYAGFIEPHDIYAGTVDVVVCDGFVGNIALKSSEGCAQWLQSMVKEAVSHMGWRRWLTWPLRSTLRLVKHQLDPAHYNGAVFLGLEGAVVKSHGNANAKGLLQAINVAIRYAQAPAVIRQHFTSTS
jgi:phosphate acyltransferase